MTSGGTGGWDELELENDEAAEEGIRRREARIGKVDDSNVHKFC